MPTVFIDTNIIITENFFRSAAARAFLKACSLLQVEVVIPEIVYDEVLGNYPKKLKEKTKAFQRAKRELAKLADFKTTEFSVEDEIDKYEDWFIELIEEDGVTLAEYPNIPAKELVDKSYENQKPFKENGDGYKDYIVWKTIKDQIENRATALPNLFLTNNTKDFGAQDDDGNPILYTELAEQIAEVAKRPKLYTSLKGVFDRELAPDLQGVELGEVPNLGAAEIKSMTEKFLLDDLPQRTAFGFENLPFSNDVSISMVGESKVAGTRLTKVGDEVVINVTGTVEIEVIGFIDKFAYYSDDGMDVTIDDADWNDHVMAVSTDLETEFELSIFYSIETETVIGHEIALPQEVKDDWPYK